MCSVNYFVSPGRHRIGGERGGKGGAMRGAKNGFGATPYFLVIKKDEKLSLLL